MTQPSRISRYLQRQQFCPAQIQTPPSAQLGILLVIPCYNEPDLLTTLEALWACKRPLCDVEVITVLNASSKAPTAAHTQNQHTREAFARWSRDHQDSKLRFFLLDFPDLPKKQAGVGLARKIGMDEAAARLEQAGHPEGIIVGFDADCACDPNYLTAIEAHFHTHPASTGATLYFEHPIAGNEAPELYDAIIQYELFLRYYTHAIGFMGFPYAFQTVGSSFAVRAETYASIGGMNRRQAGEDFYFLQKVFQTERATELRTTCVRPSPRCSDRVPFGTGKAVNDLLTQDERRYMTYAPQSLLDLRHFLADKNLFHNLDASGISDLIARQSKPLQTFLNDLDFPQLLQRIQRGTKQPQHFLRRFWQNFTAFTIMKWVHFARDNAYPNVPIEEAAHWLLQQTHPTLLSETFASQDTTQPPPQSSERTDFSVHSSDALPTARQLLALYRHIDRNASQ